MWELLCKCFWIVFKWFCDMSTWLSLLVLEWIYSAREAIEGCTFVLLTIFTPICVAMYEGFLMWYNLFKGEFLREYGYLFDKACWPVYVIDSLYCFTEITMFLGLLATVCVCVYFTRLDYYTEKRLLYVGWTCTFVTTLVTTLVCWKYGAGTSVSLFGGLLRKSEVIDLFQLVVLSLTCLFFFVGYLYLEGDTLFAYEFGPLIGFGTFALLLVLSANDLILLFLSMECQAMIMYILASYKTHDKYSLESGIKYVVLGSVASGGAVMGFSYLYLLTGSLEILTIGGRLLTDLGRDPMGSPYGYGYVFLALYLIYLSLFFKVGASPFQAWVPDVYSGASLISVMYFALVPKIAYFLVIMKFTLFMSGSYITQILDVLFFFGFLSIVLGSFGAIYQSEVKRLIGYSSVTHSGIVLVAMSIGAGVSVGLLLLYLGIYSVLTVSWFGILLAIRSWRTQESVKLIATFRNLLGTNRTLGIFFVFVLFSFVGLPPLIGFYGKLYVIYDLFACGFYGSGFVILLSSGVSAVYYLYFAKGMLFDPVDERTMYVPFNTFTALIVSFFWFINMTFAYYSSEIIEWCLNYPGGIL